jgi:serine/threonine protein kinase
VLAPDSLVLEGRFRVVRPIGSGGMGEVYLGEQVSLERKVAIKVLHHDLRRQPEMLERFKREARLLSAVEHPAVVRIIDFGESEHSACLVMELVEGESLYELLRGGPLEPARALTVLHQLAEGLAAIHDKGIIHRDLKPENVFLTRGPRGEQARLLDFGIARLVEPDADSNVSQVGVVLGTPEYLSPEQAFGARVDVRSDLYSFGVLAYRVLSGRLPFDGPTPRHFIAQHANAAPLPLARAAPALAVNAALVSMVMRLLEKDPANRFQHAHALADALREAASGPLPASLTPPEGLAPSAAEPMSSGTAVFGAAPPVPSMGGPPVELPPTGSGTAVFGGPPAAPSPVPPTGSGTGTFDGAAPAPSLLPMAGGGTAIVDELPAASVPWETSEDKRKAQPGRPVAHAPLSVPWDSPAESGKAGAEAPPPASAPTGSAQVSDPTERRPALPGQPPRGAVRERLRELIRHPRGRLVGAGLLGSLVLFGGVTLWVRSRSPEVQARRLLTEGKPAEALERLDAAPAEDREAPKLRQVRALALHALNRHDDEHALLLALDAAARRGVEKQVLEGLAEDFGQDEGDKELRELLETLPKGRLHDHFEALAEREYSAKQWGALRYLEAAQDTERLDLVKQYMKALASTDCGIRAKAARRLGALGDTSAVPALERLAQLPKETQPLSQNCGQDEAAEALEKLQKAR